MIEVLTWLLAQDHDGPVQKEIEATFAGQFAEAEYDQSYIIIIEDMYRIAKTKIEKDLIELMVRAKQEQGYVSCAMYERRLVKAGTPAASAGE